MIQTLKKRFGLVVYKRTSRTFSDERQGVFRLF